MGDKGRLIRTGGTGKKGNLFHMRGRSREIVGFFPRSPRPYGSSRNNPSGWWHEMEDPFRRLKIEVRFLLEKNITDRNRMLLEQTIRALVETLAVEGVLENDRLREAIGVVLQELHRIVEEKRKDRVERSTSPCPCGECD
jgi:hypothetical protein